MFRRRRNKLNQNTGPIYEASGQDLVETDGSAIKTNNEMLADTQYPGGGPPVELPGGVSTYEPQELNPANYTRETK